VVPRKGPEGHAFLWKMVSVGGGEGGSEDGMGLDGVIVHPKQDNELKRKYLEN